MLWQAAKEKKPLWGGGGKLNAKQRSSSGECGKGRLFECDTLIFKGRIEPSITNHLQWRWHPCVGGGSHKYKQIPMTLVHSTTQLNFFFFPPLSYSQAPFWFRFWWKFTPKKTVALWDKGQLSLPNIVSQVS